MKGFRKSGTRLPSNNQERPDLENASGHDSVKGFGGNLQRFIFFSEGKSMIPRRIFTKRFFELSTYDQVKIVIGIIQDIEDTIGRHLNPTHDRQAKQRVKRIRARAEKHGIDGV